MTAVVLPFEAPAARIAPPLVVRTALPSVRVQSIEEGLLLAQLLVACAPPRMDGLTATPAVRQREGSPPRGVVIVTDRDAHLIGAADTMRRLALEVARAGREGAAHDLLRACDQAEALAAHVHRSLN